jgi:hypothetical protein
MRAVPKRTTIRTSTAERRTKRLSPRADCRGYLLRGTSRLAVAVRALGSLKEPRRMTANFAKLPDLLRGNKSPA